ncbi:MAG: hypothetical protein U0Q55_15555 [Vicinamibacterales bacterium]
MQRAGLRRFAALLAVISLFGWLALPSEHVHASLERSHASAHVHRHYAVHLPDHIEDHDRASIDHDADPVYLSGQVFEPSHPVTPALEDNADAGTPVLPLPAPIRTRLVPPLAVHVHAPPWGRLYARRGPPAFAV